jgi:hypothetical protein
MSALGSRDRDNIVESLSERRELSAAAKALLSDKAFGYVFRKLHEQWIAQLLRSPHASEAQDELAARLRALDIILIELGLLLDNYRVDAQKAARNG